ncbi:2OG-Fe(II) oxygenase [Mycetohabitans endofungorum]|nr:2OG-Fe(II) oxygenase [Mycetohabitans endofungorum]
MQGTRGIYRVHSRHSVSLLRSGCRHALGVSFHDAR